MSFFWKPGRIIAFCCLLGFVFGGTGCSKSKSDATSSGSPKKKSNVAGPFGSFVSKTPDEDGTGQSGKNAGDSSSTGQKNLTQKKAKDGTANSLVGKNKAAPGRKFGKVAVPPRKIGSSAKKISDPPKVESGSTVNNRRLRP